MARKFLTPIDLTKLELQNAAIQNLATAPSSPATGQIYFDTVVNKLLVWNGSAWKALDENVAADWAEQGDITSSAPGDAAAAGTLDEYARGDHAHARESFASTPSTQAIGDSASGGTASTVTRGDHKHAMPGFGNVTAETSFGGSSANGSASTVARSDHAHGTPTHDGSAHSSISLSSLSAPTSDLSAGSQKITNVADPVNANDAANKGYVDGAVAGLSWKDSVRVVATTNGTLASAYENGDTVDDVTLATGDRILLAGQSTATENGIYVVKASGAPDRATDADSAADLKGAAVFVEEGTAGAGKQYVLTTDNITLGSTNLDWVQFGGGTTYTAGDGLALVGSTFNVGAGTGISVAADTVAVDTSVVARKYVGDITGNASSTSFTITHSLSNQWVNVQVIDAASPYDQVECDVERTSTSAIAVKFATAPANAKAYKVIVIG